MLRSTRLTLVSTCLIVFAVALAVKSFWVQIVEGDRWSRLAERQHYVGAVLPARRGSILDATGMPLAESRQLIMLSIAPREVRERRRLERSLLQAGVGRAVVRDALDRRKRWVPIPRRFNPSEVAVLTKMTGVYTSVATNRVALQSDGVRRLVGRTRDSLGVEGLELMLDSLLRGTPGAARDKRAPRGVRLESDEGARRLPRDGHTVVLTLNHALQDIADRALLAGVQQRRASGGDVVIVDPRTGDVLALASVRRAGPSTVATTLTEPYEPGSTLKPFIAGALLERGLARADEVIPTYDGLYKLGTRTIRDEHKAESLSLADVIRFSSNIGIVQLASRLSPGALYTLLRDLGFGSPSGVAYPSEASGTLRAPQAWSVPSQASLAMGYEVAVTPLQLALAYASIANGGELREPRLVKEIRDADGTVVYRGTPRTVRRVMAKETAQRLREVLTTVVDSGTAADADLATFDLGGKTGTARRTVAGRYARGQYTASFVGLFPARSPQLVVLVKIDDPGTTIFGGRAAAPVAKAILEGALASREGPLDAVGLAAERRRPRPAPNDTVVVRGGALAGQGAALPATATRRVGEGVSEGPRSETVDLTTMEEASFRDTARFAVPSVDGEPLRAAVARLHAAGFRVQIVRGAEGGTVPPAGTLLKRGSLVRLRRPAS
ncbi:MAG: penicillin-binding transpeptidase domain-containing protein [Gemmatimonadaceae bacterium]